MLRPLNISPTPAAPAATPEDGEEEAEAAEEEDTAGPEERNSSKGSASTVSTSREGEGCEEGLGGTAEIQRNHENPKKGRQQVEGKQH